LSRVIDKFYERLERADNFGRTITLKMKTGDFKTITRSMSKSYFIKDRSEISKMAFALLEENTDSFDKIRLIGLTASNLESEQNQDGDSQLKLDLS